MRGSADRRCALVLAGLTLLPVASSAQTQPEPAVPSKLHVRIGPGRGGGERRVEPPEPARDEPAAAEQRAKDEPASNGEAELRALREAERDLFPEPRGRPYPELDGELPINTHGGQLSAGRLHGYGFLHEACVQLWGEGGARQVGGEPRVAAVAAGGGNTCGCLLITRV